MENERMGILEMIRTLAYIQGVISQHEGTYELVFDMDDVLDELQNRAVDELMNP